MGWDAKGARVTDKDDSKFTHSNEMRCNSVKCNEEKQKAERGSTIIIPVVPNYKGVPN